MSSRNLILVVPGLLILLTVYLSATNSQPISISLAGNSYALTTGALLLAGLVAGLLSGSSLLGLKAAQTQNNQQKLEQWEAQDNKLRNEVRSDREKQLESKIATLETALKAALKKN